jgi:phage terminase small subunit
MPAAKSVETLKLHGTFRASRHGRRPARTGALGLPSDWLDTTAKTWWRNHAEQLETNGVGKGDVSMVESAATWFAIWRNTLSAIEAGDTEYRTWCRLSMAWKSFAVAAGRLGIGPTDRAKIKTDAKPASRLQKFLKNG